jgi:radical SAM superfamily enzyme YgiQ (UPF0313 family)
MPYISDIQVLPWKEFTKIAGSLGEESIVGIGGASIHEEYFQQLPKMVSEDVFKIAGGPLATIAPERILSYGFNIVATEEFEGLAGAVVDQLEGQPHPTCNEIVISGKGGYGEPHTTEYYNRLELDFSLVEDYFDLNQRVGLMTGRGCVYDCAFCAKTIKGLRLKTIESVVEEIRRVKERYNPKLFIFYDDNILVRPSRFMKLAEALVPLNIKWRSQARSNFVTPEVIRCAQEAGCVQLSFGVESGSQRILDNVNKRIKVEQNTRAFEICKRMGLKTKAFIVLGLPGETLKTIAETRDWVLKARPDVVSLYTFFPFEGSPIQKNSSAYDIEILDSTQNYYAAKGADSPCCVETKALTAKNISSARVALKNVFEREGMEVY